jgi:hypothetical protein
MAGDGRNRSISAVHPKGRPASAPGRPLRAEQGRGPWQMSLPVAARQASRPLAAKHYTARRGRFSSRICRHMPRRIRLGASRTTHPVGLLRARRERPRCGCAAEQRDEVAPFHSITSSARASSMGGTSRPSALAVLRLMTSLNVVGCSMGNSEGLSPLRILST